MLHASAKWSFRQSPGGPLEQLSPAQIASLTSSDDEFRNIESLPAEVHVELLKAGEIVDPFLKDNEKEVQWVAEQSWIFKANLSHAPLEDDEQAHLVLDRVDTFALVWLDGELIHENNNGLDCEQRIKVTKWCGRKQKHILLIQFLSPVLKARELMEQNAFKATVWNGEPARAYARCPQYTFGWDWGPKLVNVGIQGDVRLEIFKARIADFYPRFKVSGIFRNTTLLIDGDFESLANMAIHVCARITPPGGNAFDVPIEMTSSKAFHAVEGMKLVQLWSADQPHLYSVEVLLLDDEGRVFDSRKRRIGARSFRVVQEALTDSPGRSFYFELNGQDIFAGGSNWIPNDSFVARSSKERIKRWLTLAKDGNQNIIRVWGGGSYETDDFYDICDELGLLVWQDFPFACGLYPGDKQFCENVKLEAISNLKRIRHHPSLVVLAGNNEDYQVAEAEEMYTSTDEYDPEGFPAKHIYESLLPGLVKSLMDDATYFPGCPWNGGYTRNPERGDVHEWDVWHGLEMPYQWWNHLGGRFVSEFGMQAFPDVRTIEYWLDDAINERDPASDLIQCHQKAGNGKLLLDCFGEPKSLEDYVYLSQLMQSDCVSGAVQTWRGRFEGPGSYECGGSIVWQLNDCWPSISWSLVDCFERPKAAYYSMKRALAPLALGAKRPTLDEKRGLDGFLVQLWAFRTTAVEFRHVVFEIEAFDIQSGRLKQALGFGILSDTDARCMGVHGLYLSCQEADQTIVSVRAVDKKSGECVARLVNWPEPLKDVKFATPAEINLQVSLTSSFIEVKADRPVKGLIFFLKTDKVKLLDNAIDLAPGQPQRLAYHGALTREMLSWRYLGDQVI